MKKSVVLCSMIMSVSLLLGGCGNPFDHMPNLTEEESALIAEYAAGILIKHDKNGGRLASDAEIAAADEREALRQANLDALMETKEKAEEEKEQEKDTQSASPASEKTEESLPFTGIAQFCGADGFQIDYQGYMICDSYPEEDSADMVFAMDATEGNKLLILQFMAENTTSEDKELDMLSKDIRFKISVNDGEMKNALSTLLLDDLSSYRETVPAQTGVMLVLAREISEQEAAELGAISLSMKSASGNATTLLE
ncbi:MAG: hypothetical protein J6C33_05730 [Lachnospiraceae bacterium]|nr:hypothetical protein [Lachnospiraceae bacterium]